MSSTPTFRPVRVSFVASRTPCTPPLRAGPRKGAGPGQEARKERENPARPLARRERRTAWRSHDHRAWRHNRRWNAETSATLLTDLVPLQEGSTGERQAVSVQPILSETGGGEPQAGPARQSSPRPRTPRRPPASRSAARRTALVGEAASARRSATGEENAHGRSVERTREGARPPSA